MRGFKDNDSGIAAVEFALVVPVLLGLMLGGLEYSLILFTQNSSQNAVRDVGRQVATSRITTTEATQAVKNQLPHWASTSATVSIAQSAPSDPAKNTYAVTVSIPANKATPFNFLGWSYEGKTITAKAVFQQEVTP